MTETRSIADIVDELKLEIMRRNPRINDWTPLSVNRTLAEVMATQFYQLEKLIYAVADDLFINTATGDSLDKLVIDRLPDGRQPGTKATGQLTFSRSSPAPISIDIPAGTKASMPMPSGEPVYFVTTQSTTLPAGDTSVVAAAEAEDIGVAGNAPAFSITALISAPPGIMSVTNSLPFENGTDAESDEDLRARYIYAVQIPGRAIRSMIEQHMYDLESVFEAKCFNVAPGEVEIIVDCADIFSHDAAIDSTIVDNLAAGVVARGLLAATASPSGNIPSLGNSAGGHIWVRPEENVLNAESFSVIYEDHLGRPRTAIVSIPSGTPKGYAIRATLEDAGDRAVEVTDLPDEVVCSYTVLIGQGAYPYLFNLPERVPVNVTLTIRQTSTPESGLALNIKASIEDFLNDFYIGVDPEFSDLVEYIYRDYVTGRRFEGIDTITGITAAGNGQTMTSFGQAITIDNDQRVAAGAVQVNVVS